MKWALTQAKPPAPPCWVNRVRNKVGQAFSLPDFLSRGGGAMKWALTIAAFAARRAPKTQAKAPAPPCWVNRVRNKVGQAFSLPDFCRGAASVGVAR